MHTFCSKRIAGENFGQDRPIQQGDTLVCPVGAPFDLQNIAMFLNEKSLEMEMVEVDDGKLCDDDKKSEMELWNPTQMSLGVETNKPGRKRYDASIGMGHQGDKQEVDARLTRLEDDLQTSAIMTFTVGLK